MAAMSGSTPTLPYGSWPSPITAATLVQGASAVGEVRADGLDVWWSESRPSEGGRTQLVRRRADGDRRDLFGAFDPTGDRRNWNARSAVHEYGGGAWTVRDGVVVFVDWADQRLYRMTMGAEPVPITPDPIAPRGLRYREPTWLDGGWLLCVRESHEPDALAAHGQAVNELVAVPVDGSAVAHPNQVRVLVSGPDFVDSPCVDPTSPPAGPTRVAWIQWDHPRMPWDGTELVAASVERAFDLVPAAVIDAEVVAGGPEESVVQPGFLADGTLVCCTDRTGWWNPWRVERAPAPNLRPLIAGGGAEVEIGGPLWVGGLRWWAEVEPGRLVVTARSGGRDHLAELEPDGELRIIEAPFTEVSQVVAAGDDRALLVAGTPTAELAPYLLDVTTAQGEDPVARLDLLRPHLELGPGEGWYSVPEPIDFPTPGGHRAHGLYYPPANPSWHGPDDERPPLIVMIHGGPTSHARHVLALAKQFWTTRGFAVVDVDHGGSTGYGRPFRRLLDGRWGVVDVADAVAAAAHLAAEGLVDSGRMAIRGGSAGGFTTLAALCFHDTFAAGASHYGIADLSALASDTHKFESRYLDGLIGSWPDDRASYVARSPIHHTDGFDAPLLVLQGSEDEVVPPNQAEMIVAALAAKGVAHAYVLFEGEQHGFRKAENIIRALEAELWFYGRVFGFEPAGKLEPVAGAVGLGTA
jgi:dipeptidyl aminopeptidase/acylaminoacyl peptidase